MKFKALLSLFVLAMLFSACTKSPDNSSGGETPPRPLGHLDIFVEWCDEATTPACENDDYMPLAGVEIILFDNETDLNEGEPVIQTKVTNADGETTFSTEESQILYLKAVCNLGEDSQAVSIAPNQRAQVYFYFEGE